MPFGVFPASIGFLDSAANPVADTPDFV